MQQPINKRKTKRRATKKNPFLTEASQVRGTDMSVSSDLSSDDSHTPERLSVGQKERLEQWHLHNQKDFRREADQYMIGGMETKLNGIQAYLKKVEQRVEQNPPPINLAKIVSTYYESPNQNAVSNVFRLNHIAKTTHHGSPVRDGPLKQRAEFECRYDLDKYSLKQI